MDMITVTAKTLDEAITKALIELSTTSDNLEYTVVEKGSSGFFGLFGKDVVIRAKKKKDEILFIDARNVFTQVDRAHRKFSDEQIKNLGIISRLYEGKTEEFQALLAEYREKLEKAPVVSDDEDVPPKSYWQEQIDWLTTRFPDGKYVDVVGLCKAASLEGEDGIKDQDYSLNPGRYVGVVIEDDGLTEEEFKAQMLSLQQELSQLNEEAHALEAKIENNFKELLQNG